jgi:hypothetical protein
MTQSEASDDREYQRQNADAEAVVEGWKAANRETLINTNN